MEELTKKTFTEKVKTNGIVVVDFWATWCSPCNIVKTELEDIKKQQQDISIYSVNVGDNPEIALENNVNCLPTIIFYKDGEFANKIAGLCNSNAITTMLAKLKGNTK